MIRKLKSRISKKYGHRLAAVLAAVLSLLGIFLPGCLLVWQSGEKMNMADAVPVKYYSPANLAAARNISANPGDYQKLLLITGRWESNIMSADRSEAKLDNYEAAELARKQMNALYTAGIYPTNLLSGYENWYGWEAEFCKAEDASFNTYTAHFWKLSFNKYDGSEKHSVYMLENGTVFLAEAQSENGFGRDSVSKISGIDTNLYVESVKLEREFLPREKPALWEYLAFSDIDAEGLNWLDFSCWQTEDDGRLCALQAISSERYLFALQPADE